MTDWVVAIRSYNKAETLRDLTLKTLKKGNVPLDRIIVFVADEEEQRVYDSVLEGEVKTVVGVKGVKEIDNFIIDYFDEGQCYVLMDDDVRSIEFIPTRYKPRPTEPVTDLPSLFDYAFSVCKRFGNLSWSCSDTTNGLFQAPYPFCRIAPKFLIGAMSGFINDKTTRITLGPVDDFERTGLEITRKGAIVYFGRVMVKHDVATKSDSLLSYEKELLRRFPAVFKEAQRNMRFSVLLKGCRQIQNDIPREYLETTENWSEEFIPYYPGRRRKDE